MGDIIGSGEFGCVRDVADIQDTFGTFGRSITRSRGEDDPIAVKHAFKRIMQRNCGVSRAKVSGESLTDALDLRTYMSERCYRGDMPRFAVKRVREDLDPDRKCRAIADLAVEAKFLASMDHSNIVRLRATVGTPGDEDFLIMLDRLHCILNERVKEWKLEVKKCLSPMKVYVVNKERHDDLMTERLMAMFDIARALRHLHSNRYGSSLCWGK